jgi:hypothetical protein
MVGVDFPARAKFTLLKCGHDFIHRQEQGLIVRGERLETVADVKWRGSLIEDVDQDRASADQLRRANDP